MDILRVIYVPTETLTLTEFDFVSNKMVPKTWGEFRKEFLQKMINHPDLPCSIKFSVLQAPYYTITEDMLDQPVLGFLVHGQDPIKNGDTMWVEYEGA